MAVGCSWCAIPLLLLTWLFLSLRCPRVAIVLASAALLLTVPLIRGPMITSGWGEFTHSGPFKPHVGYFIWLASIVAGLWSGAKRVAIAAQPVAADGEEQVPRH